MSSRTFTHKSSSKVKKVQCRVDSCKQFIVEQGYSRHLKTAHKKENYKDLRSYGEKQFSWGKKTALNDADLPPELVTQPKEVVVGNEVEEGGDGTDEDDDNDDTVRGFRERSWDRGSSEEAKDRRELRKERDLELR